MIKNILISIILIFSFSLPVFANNINPLAEKWFIKYSKKIDQKYSDNQEILFFKNFSKQLNELLTKKKFTETQKSIINDLVKLSNERIFNKKIIIKEKTSKIILNTNPVYNLFQNKTYNENYMFLEKGVWYYYKFDNHLVFKKGQKITKNDLIYNGIDTSKDLLFIREDGNIGFVKDYDKIKLISDDIVYGITGKYNFLSEIKDDKKKLDYETDYLFKELKEKTLKITKGKSKEEKIKIIHNYILENIHYTLNFRLDEARIFSGIDTYKNKNGVCEGYVKIFLYMLNFAGIDNVKAIRGYVIDAEDFPKVGHAWVKIGDKYYDPTFDDPIGQKETLKYSEYKYFGLPYDLFYTNRYDYKSLPTYLRTESMAKRKQLIRENLASLALKYRKSNFNILKPYTFKLDNSLNLDKEIKIEDLKKIIPYSEVINFKTNINGREKTIKKLKFYTITDSLLPNLLEQLDYNLDSYHLFKWEIDGETYDYKLAYNIEFK